MVLVGGDARLLFVADEAVYRCFMEGSRFCSISFCRVHRYIHVGIFLFYFNKFLRF